MEQGSRELPSKYFTWPDYLIFGLTLFISSLVGIYHAWRGKNRTTTDYLMGGKKMSVFPITMSLAASSLSASTLLGAPTDVYMTGAMYIWCIAAIILCIPMASYLYLPVFHQLQVVSVNQYLELRFHRIIRKLSSLIYVARVLVFLSVVVYAPSLALQQVTGMDVYISVAVMFIVCTFYTSIGGIKAVVWTDVIQIFLMCGSLIAVLTKGILDIGDIGTVWERNLNSSRLEFFNIDADPTVRHTVWSVTFGGLFFWGAWYSVDQTIVQRVLATPTFRQAKISLWCNSIAASFIILICCFIGLVIHARFFDCDPLTSRIIDKADQIIPYYVMETIGNWPGLPGLFVAGIFSGALSTLSSIMNAVALVVLEDFIRPFYVNLEEQTATRITKGVSLAVGCIGFGMVFVIAHVKTILEATLAFNGASIGSIMGVFTLGMFVPWANSIGAGVGMITSYVLMMWLGIATQFAKSKGLLPNPQLKPFFTDNCPHLNSSFLDDVIVSSTSFSDGLFPQEEEVFVLLKLSYWWYTLMGVIIVVVVGTLVSLLTGRQDPTKLNRKLLSPIIRGAFKTERKYIRKGESSHNKDEEISLNHL